MAFLPCSKTDPDYGRGISPYDDGAPAPVKCYWCDEVIDETIIIYEGKPHHVGCACENILGEE